VTRSLDLLLQPRERRLAARLAGRWTDLLYIPGPGFTSPLEPGLYRSSVVILPANGAPIRVSSFPIPAFGVTLCRLCLEGVRSLRREHFGSFFDPSRRGIVYTMSADRRSGAVVPPPAVLPEWSYHGASLSSRLAGVTAVRVLSERVSAASGEEMVSWVADRGLALAGADGKESLLLLAVADSDDRVAILPEVGLYRALLDPTAPLVPGATVRELLGYGDWDGEMEIAVELAEVGSSGGAGAPL
jgi:hypothetical protein